MVNKGLAMSKLGWRLDFFRQASDKTKKIKIKNSEYDLNQTKKKALMSHSIDTRTAGFHG